MDKLIVPYNRTHADGRLLEQGWRFYCVACAATHRLPTLDRVRPKMVWTMTGNPAHPSFTPSLRLYTVQDGKSATYCHLIILHATLCYQNDQPGEYAGRHVPMVPVPDEYLP